MLRAGARSMHGIGFRLAAILLVIGMAPNSAGSASESIDAVTTPGAGKLTMCRNWLVYSSCTTYRKVVLPERVAVGDQITLSYGSNPKTYVFHVVRLRQQGNRCTLLSEASGPNDEGEKIEVAQCARTAKPVANGG